MNTTSSSGDLSGNLSALVAASVFGAAVVAARTAVQEVPPLNLALFRFAQGGLILFLILFLWSRDSLKVDRRDLPYLTLLGAVMFAIFPFTFHLGVRYTEASRGALMIATMPIWSAVLARIRGGERLTPRQLAGVGLTFLGVGLVIAFRGLNWRTDGWALLGDGFMLLTAFCGAVYGVLAKPMLRRYPPMTVTAYAMILGTIILFPAALWEGLPQAWAAVHGQTLWLILFLGVICGAGGFLLWTQALSRLSPTQVAVYANCNPLVAIILGVVLLSEKLTGPFLIGLALTGAGVTLVNWPTKVKSD